MSEALNDSIPTTPPSGPVTDHMVEARKRWTECHSFYHSIHTESRLDWEFYSNKQWDESLKQEREDAGKPCITNNRISTFVRNIDNQIGAMKITAKVTAVSDATEDDAENLQGLIKAIEGDSEADIAYGTARKAMIIGGFGYSRVTADYAAWNSFDQNLKVDRILDPHTVMFDPNSKRLDRTDAKYCFVACKYTVEAAKAIFGDKVDLTDWDQYEGLSEWHEGEQFVWFADYYWVEEIPHTLYQWADQQGNLKAGLFEDMPAGVKVLQKRETTKRKIHWEVLSGVKIIEEHEVAGDYIPIAPCIADEMIINGQLELVGLVRYLRDPQRMLNYWESAIAQTIGFAPISPFIGYGSVIGRFQKDWEEMNTNPKPILRCEAIPDGKGGYLPLPSRDNAEPPIQAMVAGRTMTEENLSSVSGLFDPSIGKGSTDQSGRAVQALQSQGNLATWNYTNSFNMHVRHVCNIILSQIPTYYDAGRLMQINGLDGQKRSLFVFNSNVNESPMVPQGTAHVIDIGQGKYSLSIDAAPGERTMREQNTQFWIQMVQKFPEIMQVAGDLIVAELDSPQSKAISERLKAVLPPQIQALLQGGQPNPQAQQAQAKLAQAQQIIQQLVQERQAKKLELASKERIAAGGDAASIAVAEINAKQDQNESVLDAQIKTLSELFGLSTEHMNMAHEVGMQAMGHKQNLQQMEQQHDQGLEAGEVAHSQGMEATEQQASLPTGKLPASA